MKVILAAVSGLGLGIVAIGVFLIFVTMHPFDRKDQSAGELILWIVSACIIGSATYRQFFLH
jgi:hypothetical protein